MEVWRSLGLPQFARLRIGKGCSPALTLSFGLRGSVIFTTLANLTTAPPIDLEAEGRKRAGISMDRVSIEATLIHAAEVTR